MLPALGGLDAGNVRITAYQRDRDVRKSLLVKIPKQDMPAAVHEIADAQTLRDLAGVGRVVVDIQSEMHDIVRQSPGLALEHGCGDGMAPDQLQVFTKHILHFLRVDAGVFLLQPAFQGVVQHNQPGFRPRADVEQVGGVVGDDAIVVRRRLKRFGQADQTRVDRHGAHPPVPSLVIFAGEVNNDVQLVAQHSELIDPGLVTIEHEQRLIARHIFVGCHLHSLLLLWTDGIQLRRRRHGAGAPHAVSAVLQGNRPADSHTVWIIGHPRRSS